MKRPAYATILLLVAALAREACGRLGPAAGLKRMNPLNEWAWTIQIGPDETQQVTYTYQTYLRR